MGKGSLIDGWLATTLGNEHWVRKNEEAIKDVLPNSWTHMGNLNGLQIGFRFKLLGIDWRSEDQLSEVMVWLEKLGIMKRDAYCVRKNPVSIFKENIHA